MTHAAADPLEGDALISEHWCEDAPDCVPPNLPETRRYQLSLGRAADGAPVMDAPFGPVTRMSVSC